MCLCVHYWSLWLWGRVWWYQVWVKLFICQPKISSLLYFCLQLLNVRSFEEKCCASEIKITLQALSVSRCVANLLCRTHVFSGRTREKNTGCIRRASEGAAVVGWQDSKRSNFLMHHYIFPSFPDALAWYECVCCHKGPRWLSKGTKQPNRQASRDDCEDGHLTGLFLKGVQHITGHLCLHLWLQLCHLHPARGWISSFFNGDPEPLNWMICWNLLVEPFFIFLYSYNISKPLLVPLLLLFMLFFFF